MQQNNDLKEDFLPSRRLDNKSSFAWVKATQARIAKSRLTIEIFIFRNVAKVTTDQLGEIKRPMAAAGKVNRQALNSQSFGPQRTEFEVNNCACSL